MNGKGFMVIEIMLVALFATLIGYTSHEIVVNLRPDPEFPHMTVGAVKDYKAKATSSTWPLCKGDDCSKEYPWLTNAKVREYRALERALVGGGTQAIIRSAAKSGCFDRIKVVDGAEVKQCWGAIRPAGKDSKWECEERSRREAPQCYGRSQPSDQGGK